MPESRPAVFLLAGGRGMITRRGPDPLLQHVMRQSGAARPHIAYLGAASGDAAAFRVMIGRFLKQAGAGQVTLAPLCGRRADRDRAQKVLSGADLVFVSGGDVEAGMRALREADMVGFLRELAQSGKRFFGLSAGSIMLARQWVRWEDPGDDATAERFPCLGLADVWCDTHGEGEGWEELQALLRLAPEGSVGHGIVSGTALVVSADGSVSALGGEVHRFRREAGGVVRIASLVPGAPD